MVSKFQVRVTTATYANRTAFVRYAVFQGTDGRRTLVALLPGIATQFIGLKLFGSFGTYFFQQAGLKNPFTIKCITSSIQIATIISTILLADTIGRRLLACSAVTLSWISCLVVGILGVAKTSNATTYVFVLFTCLWSKFAQFSSQNSKLIHAVRCWSAWSQRPGY